jgi:nitrite reductase (NADH) small subunit
MSVTEQPLATAPVRAHVLGRVEEIPLGEGRAYVAGEAQVAVFRLRDGSLHATQAACPHAGGPLADGQTDADVLVCPLHLYGFRWSDGAATGADLRLRVYPVRDVDGDLVVDA